MADKRPELSEDTAGKLLANVFDACNMEQNTIPLVKLASYSEYRREKYSLQKVIVAVILVVFLALPLCFISPEFTVKRISEDNARIPVYEIRIKKFMPVSYVTATVNGNTQAVYETGERTYAVEPSENGEMDVKVEFINRQYKWSSEQVEGTINVEAVDTKAPKLNPEKGDKGSSSVNGELHIWLIEEGSGIDYENAVCILNSGEERKPIRWDDNEKLIVFDFPTESANIFIPDKRENELQLVITVK